MSLHSPFRSKRPFRPIPLLPFVIQRSRTTLEYLQIPAESVDVKSMSSCTWPCLQHLVLRGYQPADPAPLVTLFVHLPQLRFLDIQLLVFRQNLPFTIWPADYQPEFAQKELLPNLEWLTLSNPDLRNQLLFNFPPGLKYLSLISCPTTYATYSELTSNTMNTENVTHVLRHNNLSFLTTLKISVSSNINEDLLEAISSGSPLLEILHIYRWRLAERMLMNKVSMFFL